MKQIWLFVVAALFALTTTMAFAGQAMPAASGKTMEEQNAGGMGTKMEDTKMQGETMKMEEKKGAMGTKMEGTQMEDTKMDGGGMKMEGKK